jgi:UDP-N-acetyl-D-mannosaminuronic acid dehydrogenase
MGREINTEMPAYIARLVISLLAGTAHPKIAVLGISYKGNVEDCRESPALTVIHILQKAGYDIAIFDPYAERETDLAATVKNADMMLILTDHDEFRDLDYQALSRIMRNPLLFDTRNLLNPDDFADSPIAFFNLGSSMAYGRQ